jgi:hypothetical protein
MALVQTVFLEQVKLHCLARNPQVVAMRLTPVEYRILGEKLQDWLEVLQKQHQHCMDGNLSLRPKEMQQISMLYIDI